MALISAEKSSNSNIGTGDHGLGVGEGDPSKCGYTTIDAGDQATNIESDVSDVSKPIGGAQLGTNIKSYRFQPETVDAKSGVPPSQGSK